MKKGRLKMTYEEASALVKRFVELSTENQKAQGNKYADARVTGQLIALLSISLSDGNTEALRRMNKMTTEALRRMIKMTEEIELNNQTPNEK
ncbi:MAG TPA: hypothetical protein PLM34_04935 [Lentimicrobium sp.]|nr:hypothetical protein [Lentimicrobium sp.]